MFKANYNLFPNTYKELMEVSGEMRNGLKFNIHLTRPWGSKIVELIMPNFKIYVNDFPVEVDLSFESVFKDIYKRYKINSKAASMVVCRILAPLDSNLWAFEVKPWLRKFYLTNEAESHQMFNSIGMMVDREMLASEKEFRSQGKGTPKSVKSNEARGGANCDCEAIAKQKGSGKWAAAGRFFLSDCGDAKCPMA
jgi:hypothetical protein